MDRKEQERLYDIVTDEEKWQKEVTKMVEFVVNITDVEEEKEMRERMTVSLRDSTIEGLEGAANFFQFIADIAFTYSQECLLKRRIVAQQAGSTIYNQMRGRKEVQK